ncbi:MAG: SH3 domain-containing protein [Lachnospiraceae bacterium]|nr:SH3 domain-containing protein [Lachnospiraceae bacterium]
MNKDIYSKIVPFVKKNIKFTAPVFLFVVAAIVTFVALSARSRRDMNPDVVAITSTPAETVVNEEVPVEVPLALSENTDAAITDFIVEYYLCLSNGDVDKLDILMDSIETKDKLVKAEQSKYLDYAVTGIYTMPGYDDNSVVVFAVSDVIFNDYSEYPLPSYDGFYLKRNADGTYVIINTELSPEENAYTDSVLVCEDVVELGNRIITDYNDVITAHPELLTYMKELDSIVSLEAGEKLAALNAGEEIEMPEIELPAEDGEEESKTATANATVNVRVSDSMNADTMGQLRGGETVEILETKGNGWSKISFDGKEGYVKTEYLTLDIDIDSVVTIGTVTALETLNIRAAASTEGMIMGSFAKGTTARLISEQDGWCEVVYNGKVVYLSSEYLEIVLD